MQMLRLSDLDFPELMFIANTRAKNLLECPGMEPDEELYMLCVQQLQANPLFEHYGNELISVEIVGRTYGSIN